MKKLMKKLVIFILSAFALVKANAQTEKFHFGGQIITVGMNETINEYYNSFFNNEDEWVCIPAVIECGAKKYGNPKAEYLYGIALTQGIDVQKNISEGMKWLRKSADQGDAEAANELGAFLDEAGQESEAERYFLQAIRKPALYAYFNLGSLYLRQNKLELAERYLLLAINKGPRNQAEAIRNIVVLYARQDRVSDMFELLKKGAYEYNNPWCQRNLGFLLYEQGVALNNQPTEREKREGIALLKKAANAGDQEAIQYLKKINK